MEVRYKGRLAWFPATVVKVAEALSTGPTFDVAYADGDHETAVPRIRVRARAPP